MKKLEKLLTKVLDALFTCYGYKQGLKLFKELVGYIRL